VLTGIEVDALKLFRSRNKTL